MPTANKLLKNFSLFVDGRGYAGNIEELQLPNLTLTGEDFRAGGMDAPVFVEMGQEKLEAKFTLTGYDKDALALWGVGEGGNVVMVARGAVQSLDGTVEQVKVTMTVKIKSVEPGAWKAGEKSSLAFTVSCTAYKYEQGGNTLHDIDILNMKRVVNGTDALESIRTAIGI